MSQPSLSLCGHRHASYLLSVVGYDTAMFTRQPGMTITLRTVLSFGNFWTVCPFILDILEVFGSVLVMNIGTLRKNIVLEVFDFQQLQDCLQDYSKPRDKIRLLIAKGDILRVKKGLSGYKLQPTKAGTTILLTKLP